MRKLLLALLIGIAGFGLVACNNTDKPETPKDDDIVEVPEEPKVPAVEKVFITLNFGYEIDNEIIETDKGNVIDIATPAREGYKFIGWFNGDIEFNVETPINEDIVLTANWEKEIVYVYITISGYPDKMIDHIAGEPLFIEEPTREGYIFKGWTTSLGEEFVQGTIYTENAKLFEDWETIPLESKDIDVSSNLSNLEFDFKNQEVYKGLSLGTSASKIPYNQVYQLQIKNDNPLIFNTRGSAYSHGGPYGQTKVFILQAHPQFGDAYIEFEVDQDYEVQLTFRTWQSKGNPTWYQLLKVENDNNINIINQEEVDLKGNVSGDAITKTFLIKKGYVKISYSLIGLYETKIGIEKISFK